MLLYVSLFLSHSLWWPLVWSASAVASSVARMVVRMRPIALGALSTQWKTLSVELCLASALWYKRTEKNENIDTSLFFAQLMAVKKCSMVSRRGFGTFCIFFGTCLRFYYSKLCYVSQSNSWRNPISQSVISRLGNSLPHSLCAGALSYS